MNSHIRNDIVLHILFNDFRISLLTYYGRFVRQFFNWAVKRSVCKNIIRGDGKQTYGVYEKNLVYIFQHQKLAIADCVCVLSQKLDIRSQTKRPRIKFHMLRKIEKVNILLFHVLFSRMVVLAYVNIICVGKEKMYMCVCVPRSTSFSLCTKLRFFHNRLSLDFCEKIEKRLFLFCPSPVIFEGLLNVTRLLKGLKIA